MTNDEELAQRMIAAHWRRAACAKTEAKRMQHIRAIDRYLEKFKSLFGPVGASAVSGKFLQYREHTKSRNWNLPLNEQTKEYLE